MEKCWKIFSTTWRQQRKLRNIAKIATAAEAQLRLDFACVVA